MNKGYYESIQQGRLIKLMKPWSLIQHLRVRPRNAGEEKLEPGAGLRIHEFYLSLLRFLLLFSFCEQGN